MRNLFNSVFVSPKKRNPFGLTHSNDFTTDYGFITPVLCFDTYAGEIFRLFNESFVRTQPLRAPAFMQADVSYHWFFVPHRLVYQDWSDFIVRGSDGNTVYDKPFCTIGDMYGGDDEHPVDSFLTPGSLFDYLNFPTFNDSTMWNDVVKAKDFRVDMMPFNAYNLIYNEYYRDENLQPEVFIWDMSGRVGNLQDLADYQTEVSADFSAVAALFVVPWIIRKRAWRKDYFTSALPFVQKGSPISLAGSVNPVNGQNWIPVHFGLQNWQSGDAGNWFLGIRGVSSGPLSADIYAFSRTAAANAADGHVHTPNSTAPNSQFTRFVNAAVQLPELQTNVMSISDLRVALALQQWFELNARTGSDRYYEYLLGHFGVRDRDSRLQRPEYIGGYSHSIQISEVEQNSQTTSSSPQGNLAGRGLGFSVNSAMTYRCPEPGWIMCLQSIRPRSVYYQGWPRMYQRWDSFDYFDPYFDHLSEQNIKISELYFDPSIEPLSSDDDDFGYTPRFAEYRWLPNQLHGDMRASLSYWVSPRRIDSSNCRLDSNFITVDGYSQNLYESFSYVGTASQPAPHFICHVVNHVKAVRPMSRYATPKL